MKLGLVKDIICGIVFLVILVVFMKDHKQEDEE
jgi:hypothetical protein